MRVCCELLADGCSVPSGNLGIVFDEFILEDDYRIVQRFVGMHSEYLL